jgi:predicted glycosyltransferase
MHDELGLGLRAHAARQPGAPAVLGLRDILDSPAAIREEWRTNGHTKVIRETYKTVLCYGDPAVYDPVREYGLPSDVAERVRFTGYLADGLLAAKAHEVRGRHGIADERLAVCTLGGGKDAAHVAQAFLSAMERLRRRGWVGVLITGPYMAPGDIDRLRGHQGARRVQVIQMVDDLPSYLAAADAAVCMGGYNTICEVLALAVRAVIIPRIHPRQEQRMRAERLAARGLLRWLHPTGLSSDGLADSIESVAALPRAELAARIVTIAHHGIQASAQHLAALLPAQRSAAATDRHQPSERKPSEMTGVLR